MQKSLSRTALAGLAALAAVAATPSVAQDFTIGDPFADFATIDATAPVPSSGFEVAPGYNRPDFDTVPLERVEITVFEEPPLSNEPAALDRPINQFAGEVQRFEQGFLGDIFRRR